MTVSVLYPTRQLSNAEEPRVLLEGVPWSTYVMLRDTVDRPGLRMIFLEGALEIMRTSRTHEITKAQVARLFELCCLDRNIPLFAYGSTTFRKEEKQRGLEPDECYCRGADREIPDVAIEVVITAGLLDKLDVYSGLGVREVWLFENTRTRVLALGEAGYQPAPRSLVFPEVDLERLREHALQPDQHAALIAFRDELRREPRP